MAEITQGEAGLYAAYSVDNVLGISAMNPEFVNLYASGRRLARGLLLSTRFRPSLSKALIQTRIIGPEWNVMSSPENW